MSRSIEWFGHTSIDSEDTSWRDLPRQKRNAHFERDTYGSFKLTNAIRPALDFRPVEGCRYNFHVENDDKVVPFCLIAASREKLFALFQDLIQAGGDTAVNTYFYSNVHGQAMEMEREEIDAAVIRSRLFEFDDLFLNDGRTAVSIVHPSMKIRLDDHKLLSVYGEDVRELSELLREYGIYENPNMKFIKDQGHVHLTEARFQEQFLDLVDSIGAIPFGEQMDDDDERLQYA